MADNGITQETIQSRVTQDDVGWSLSILPFLMKAGELLSPWWSRQRDLELSRFWRQSDHVSSAMSMLTSKVSSIPLKIIPRDMSIKAHVRQAEIKNTMIVDGSDFFAGWHTSLLPKTVEAWWTQDNGIFWEVIGDGPKDQPLKEVLGIAFLDSQRCTRTSNVEFPVLYQDTDGQLYRLHRTRVVFSSSQPSGLARMNAVGFCALSRMLNTAQNLIDIGVFNQEKLGSRPHRNMIIGKSGITATEIVTAFSLAEKSMDAQGLSRYAKNVVIAPPHRVSAANAIDIDIRSLAELPDGFDEQEKTTLGMFLIALALNVPPRWLWPATQAGATKADAMFSHTVGMGGGIGHLLMVLTSMLGGDKLATALKKPVPSHLKVIFDFQDDEQDRQQAEIRDKRSETNERDINDNVINIRVARERMLEAGDISEAQFKQLELEDGHLPDGQDVLNLFLSTDPDMQQLLGLSIGDVLNVEANDRELVLSAIDEKERLVRAELASPSRVAMFGKAKMALIALEALRELYEGKEAQEEKVSESLIENEPV